MSDVSGTTTYGYDTRNRLTSKQTPFGTLSYTYDPAGNLLTLGSSNPNGASLTYTYDALNRLATVTDNRLLAQGATSGLTTYNYDAVGNLQNFVYPNGVTHAYTYDTLNRLTQMGSSNNSAAISNYAYSLGAAGNRLTVAELSGRAVAYAYDSLYRLTTETVSADPNNKNGAINYTYDAVGNRKTLNATLPPAGGISYTYDADDRLGSDQYDNNGNTILSAGVSDVYDFENHLIQKGGVTIVYDGDGNRVSETVAGTTTNYLVDSVNPTGYAQVVDELQGGTVTRTYSYGPERINENQILNSAWSASFYGYDGHGSVRQLTNSAGTVTDTYDYDAFGNSINSTGSTPNVYLFAGEQYDPALALYYNRARELNTQTGRFTSMDTVEGDSQDPLSLQHYIYAEQDPTNNLDPSGNEIDEITGAFSVAAVINAMPQISAQGVIGGVKSVIRDDPKDLWLVPKRDVQQYGQPSGWAAETLPSRDILYVLERKDGKPLHNRDYNWTVAEHQTNKQLTKGPNGTSVGTISGHFCDQITPNLSKLPIKTDQTFTISPQPGDFSPANENHDVFVHSQAGDFGTLGIYEDERTIYINGLKKWPGTTDDTCYE